MLSGLVLTNYRLEFLECFIGPEIGRRKDRVLYRVAVLVRRFLHGYALYGVL